MNFNINYNLVTQYPIIARNWNYEKNTGLSPFDFAPKSCKKVWWKCDFNPSHEWESRISNRTIKHGECPICYKEFKISFPAKVIYYYLKKIYPQTQCEYKIKRYKIDIYIPELLLAIEHDGAYHHNTKNARIRDQKKDKNLIDLGYKILRIKETKNQTKKIIIKDNIIYYNYEYQYKNNLNQVTETVIKYISNISNQPFSGDIDLERDYFYIEQFFFHEKKKKTISYLYPELVKEWSENNPITPDLVYTKNNTKFLWKCPNCKKEYQATLSNRINANSSCPYCANKKVNENNCLASKYPELAKEWDYERNQDLTPYDVVPGTERKVWWKCQNNHYWKALIYQRTGSKHTGCPYCNHNKAYKEISLAFTYSELIEWWDHDKNDINTPQNTTTYSNKKIYWKCPNCNYSFIKMPNEIVKVKKENRCPNCVKTNILNNKLKHIKKYWSNLNNVSLTYDLIKEDKQYIWKCKEKHIWQESIKIMLNKKRKCPYCFPNKRQNYLPENLLKEWDYERNNPINPKFLTKGSGKKVWWKCRYNHHWQEQIQKRALRFYGCPYCSGKKASINYNLKVIDPEVIKYWDTTKNSNLSPETVTPGSGKKVWWKCPTCNYQFERTITNMVKINNCPNCKKRKKYLSLDKEYPNIIKEWNQQKNSKQPSEYSAHSNKKVWWKCSVCNYEWKTNIYSRTAKKTGCPNCYLKSRITVNINK